MHAISTITSVSTSRPVISRSIQTSRSSAAATEAGALLGSGTRRTLSGLRLTGRFHADDRSLRRLATRRRPAAQQQRRAVHGRRGHRRFSRARRAFDRRSRVVLGRGGALPRHPVLAAVRPCARHDRRRSRGRSGSSAGSATWRSPVSTATPTIPRSGTTPRSCGRAKKATVRTLTWTELRTPHRPHRVRAARPGRAAWRRGRPVPADGARDGRRAVRGRQARRGVPADLLGLRRRRGRRAARGRGRGRAHHRRRLHPAGQDGADEGDGRRGGRPGRHRPHGRGRAPPGARRSSDEARP